MNRVGCHPLFFFIVVVALAIGAAIATADDDVGPFPQTGCIYRWETDTNGPWEDGSMVWSVHLQDSHYDGESQIGGRTYFEVFADAETDTFDLRIHQLTPTPCEQEVRQVIGDTMDVIIGLEKWPDEAPEYRGLYSYWQWVSQFYNWQYSSRNQHQYLPAIMAGWMTGPG